MSKMTTYFRCPLHPRKRTSDSTDIGSAIQSPRRREAEWRWGHQSRFCSLEIDQKRRVISTSPGELDSVFQTILEKATRLCTAKFGFLWQVKDGNAKIVSPPTYEFSVAIGAG